jgi:hypothetical protein
LPPDRQESLQHVSLQRYKFPKKLT